LKKLRTELKKRKAQQMVRRLIPELVQEMLVSADDDDYGSPSDVIPQLLEFMPENPRTRHVLLCRLLVAVIKHGDDDNADLARTLLLMDESNATQALPGMWGLQHLACRYGRLKTLRLLLSFGLSPTSRVVINGLPHEPLDIAKKFSSEIVPQLKKLLESTTAVARAVHLDQDLLPMLQSCVAESFLGRKRVDLSLAFQSSDAG
jgi:hypothetical protein